MRRRKSLAMLVVSCVCAPSLALADDGPWAEIGVGGQTDAKRAQYDVMVAVIDGSMDFPDRSVYRLAPGRHGLRLASYKRGAGGAMTAQPLALELQPCMRYVLAADHSRPEPQRSWRPRVVAAEPIAKCAKKYADRMSPTASPMASTEP